MNLRKYIAKTEADAAFISNICHRMNDRDRFLVNLQLEKQSICDSDLGWPVNFLEFMGFSHPIEYQVIYQLTSDQLKETLREVGNELLTDMKPFLNEDLMKIIQSIFIDQTNVFADYDPGLFWIISGVGITPDFESWFYQFILRDTRMIPTLRSFHTALIKAYVTLNKSIYPYKLYDMLKIYPMIATNPIILKERTEYIRDRIRIEHEDDLIENFMEGVYSDDDARNQIECEIKRFFVQYIDSQLLDVNASMSDVARHFEMGHLGGLITINICHPNYWEMTLCELIGYEYNLNTDVEIIDDHLSLVIDYDHDAFLYAPMSWLYDTFSTDHVLHERNGKTHWGSSCKQKYISTTTELIQSGTIKLLDRILKRIQPQPCVTDTNDITRLGDILREENT